MSDLHEIGELRPPPSPSAMPAGRTVAARPVAEARPLPRPHAPDLVRKAQLETTRGRLVIAAAGFAALFGAVSVKLAIATIVAPATPKLRAAPRVPDGTPSIGRAAITDRNGEVLAVSLQVTELYANPQEINDPVEAADKLRAVLPGLDRERLIARISQRTVGDSERPVQFAYIARNLPPRQQQAVNDLGVPGFHFRPAERRLYPQGRAAAHVLGQVDIDGHGIAGVEKHFDQRLRSSHDPLRLSIDVRLQVALRDSVEKAIADFNGVGGAGVVMDVNTAEVLAMVSLPDFDASDPGGVQQRSAEVESDSPIRKVVARPAAPKPVRQDQDPHFNRATVGVYEPGSTFKLLTASMVLDAGAANIWSTFDARHPIHYGRFTISDYKGKNRILVFPEVLAYSSNLGAAHMAQLMGPQRHREFMGRMGMLNRLQVELPETARPLAPSANGWKEINTFTIGFGHGISVTPLHVITGVSAVANGGILRQPTLVAQPDGQPREGTRVLSEKTSETMRRLMRLVVTDGSGKGADVPGYFVGGKTGTAEKTTARGGYQKDKRIAAFVGAFPMNAPRYAIYVMVDEPKPNAKSHGYATAGWVAAPAAGAVIARIAPVLGMVPETERMAQIQQGLSIPLQPGRPAGGAPKAPVAAAPTAPPAAPRANIPAAATPAAPNPPAQPVPVPPTTLQPPALRRTEAPAPFRLAAVPDAMDEAGLASR
ncbi:peptidoglycan D,D-transpeptidase FtsI family protein [Roseicella frigidaeris]|uniref:Penicillin-binding protein 2 n=1 Tax=Roseicella frigidaeris TaxID=2230885 RepID=A0A327M930_9PROT|nr:penicillin-binding protein 2 [Roseicella frigidaeris]RAI59239.1 penicillin-binding protein 2 [Roseicella frigidaeris]